jgi:hypothetical protein
MAHGKILLHHVSQSKTIQAQKLNVLDYFKIIIKLFEIIKSWDMWQHIACSHCLTKKLASFSQVIIHILLIKGWRCISLKK